MDNFNIHILYKPDQVTAFVDDARIASDSEKDALGFLPERAYKDAAEQGKLLVAVVRRGDDSAYAGHLLYGGVFPQARVFQIFTAASFRRRGVARSLVEALVCKSEDLNFLSVVARVAEDLAANLFWERLGFEVVRTKPGGRSTGRQINIRVRELDTPRLFSLNANFGQSSLQDLILTARIGDVAPIYVLDLNVVYDLVKKRANAEDVGRIISASFNNLVRLAVTEEFIRELERTSVPTPTDPILELALKLPRLPSPPSNQLTEIVANLGALVFPVGIRRTQDLSDLVHLATAIHHKAAGFITGEKAILRARQPLESQFALDVVGANDFADTVEPSDCGEPFEIQALADGHLLQARPRNIDDGPTIETFLQKLKCPEPLLRKFTRSEPGRPHRQFIATCDGSIIAFGSWELPSAIRPQIEVFICADEDHPSVNRAADFLLDSASKEALFEYPVLLSLHVLPGHVTTRRIAIAHGFRPSPDARSGNGNLRKIALAQIVTATNWPSIRQQLTRRMELRFPDSFPTYQAFDQTLAVRTPSGSVMDVPLGELESLLSPVLFCLPGRSGAIVPIRKEYATDLLGGSQQLSLLASPEAVLLRERVYFSHPRTGSVLKRGIPILFYESGRKGGSASVTGVARIIRVEVVPRDTANHELLRRGVLDKKILKKICLAKTVVATTIDNIMILKRPVRLERLRELKAVDGANLVTARSLSADQIIQIVEEGNL